ncbi:HMA2 domain-containing protein [Parvibaculum sp.]|uniref:HMA2 domain-containing protein n=1 Tax=Parvibaculum sp. TaxID=2024848 RepID=UPI001B10DA34|nr:hypothetical protein [Parvibaculum sp.]MBO6668633.1 hypothetical protein [Parvibaculum sp.]MBO6691190.1 hypothetical protein [Parvibaculum sp.]MBO6714309.1 hypothetical protein [Parvibaculum sp.]
MPRQKPNSPKAGQAVHGTKEKADAAEGPENKDASPLPAILEHLTAERARLRLPKLRRDRDAFDRLATATAALPGVQAVEANPLTAGMLIRHGGDFAAIAVAAKAAGLFSLEEAERAPDMLKELRARMKHLERGLRQHSEGALDINSASFLFFAAVGAVQLARGRVAMPALTAFWYAMNALRTASFDEARPKDGKKRKKR